MRLHSFDQTPLIDRIEQLSPGLRLVFAAACAQRLQSGYAEYARRAAKRPVTATAKRMLSASSSLAAAAMDEVWTGLLTGRWNRQKIETLTRKCLEPARHQYFQDVASAVGYALSSCLTKASWDVVRVTRVAYAAAAEIVIKSEDVRSFTPAVEQRLLAAPVVRSELQRQARDLAELSASRREVMENALRMRERARTEAWKLP